MFLCAPASEEIKTAITNLDPANSADAVNKAPNMHSSIKEKLSQYGNSIADELRKGFEGIIILTPLYSSLWAMIHSL